MAKKKEEVIQQASAAVKANFNLSKFKEKKGFGAQNAKFKEQTWIPLSKAFQEVTSLPGIPQGHLTILRGHSDTGKTTTLLEAATAAQKAGILPVFIITEMKFNWQFAKSMGFQFEEVVDPETGEVTGYDGFFIYADRGTLSTIEDVATFINDLLDEQSKGNLPYNLCFFWDSVGSVPCRMSVESKSVNAQWDAAALSQQFAKHIDQKIVLSRKQSSPYTNTLVIVNKIWVSAPASFMASPKINNKGGESLGYDSSLIVTFGNIDSAGTVKLKAIANKHEFEWGKRTNISIDKNHVGGVTSKGKVVMTPTGFISLDDVEKYKNQHKGEWAKQLGSSDITYEEEEEKEDSGILVGIDD